MRFPKLRWSVAALVIFFAGLILGVYYHREITVIFNHLQVQFHGFSPVSAPVPTPAASDSVSSTIDLLALEQPLPLVYSDTLEESVLQEYLKQGAVVLPLGTSFGEPGNVVVTAHSSGTTAFGPYRFAFAKLGELEENQEFNINTPTAIYTYRVYAKEIVWPHEVDKLPNDDRSTVTLVTCWPLWTNFQRLLVHAELVNTEYKI